MRNALSTILVQKAVADERVLILSGDHGYALFDELRNNRPDQFINCGIAEQNMVGVAAGLAKAGFLPIVYGLAAFVPMRVLEQIKIDICFEGLPVVLLGDGAGFVYSGLGSSHQAFEDVSALRALPNISIFSPADRFELSCSFEEAFASASPCYLRLGKADLGDIHSGPMVRAPADFIFPVIAESSHNLCLASGSMVSIAQKAIEKSGVPFDLYSIAQIKGAGDDTLRQLCQGRERIVTVEEHSVYGGLGSLVAETIVGNFSGRFEIIGIRDRFSGECGTYEHLLKHHNLDADSLTEIFRKGGM